MQTDYICHPLLNRASQIMNPKNFFLSGTGSLTYWNIKFPLSRISSLLVPELLCQLTLYICQGQCYTVEIWPSTCSTHDQGFALFLCHWPSPDPSLTSPETFRKLWLLGWGISQGRLEGLQHGRADEFGFEMFQTCWICRGHSSPAASFYQESPAWCSAGRSLKASCMGG